MPIVDGSLQTFEITVTTVAAALTPYMAYKFRERRLRRPRTASEQLYQYYENYIDRLEKQLAKKDTIIFAQEQQIRDQQQAIEKLQRELDQQKRVLADRQQLIDELKEDVRDMQEKSDQFHARIEEIKSKNPGITGKTGENK